MVNNEWITAFEAHLLRKATPPPKEWKSVAQIALEMDKTRGYANKIVSKLRRAGVAEMKNFTIRVGDSGQIRSVPHYRITGKKKND